MCLLLMLLLPLPLLQYCLTLAWYGTESIGTPDLLLLMMLLLMMR